MEHDIALREMSMKRKSDERPVRNAFVDEFVNILKSEFPVVLRMSHWTTTLGAEPSHDPPFIGCNRLQQAK
jgi:hypothetical protein